MTGCSNNRWTLAVAWRYLWGGKRYAAVNVITWVSIVGVALATAAILIVLSVFNGFRGVAERQLAAIDPDVRVTAAAPGQPILNADSALAAVRAVDDVAHAALMMEQRGVAVTPSMQMPVRWRAVDIDEYRQVAGIDSIVIDGCWLQGSAALSVGVAVGTTARPGGSLTLYVPRRRGRITQANAITAFRADTAVVGAVLRMGNQDYDADMMYIPLDEGRRLLDYYDGEATSIEIGSKPGTDAEALQRRLQRTLGPSYLAQRRQQLQQESFRMIAVEKWITFAMLAFILVIASFNVVSTLVMLRLEKEQDAWTLRALGASSGAIRGIFRWQGRYIAAAGCLLGLFIGLALCLAQEWGGFIRLNAAPGTTAVQAYPVVVEWWDILVVAAVSLCVSLLATRAATLRRQ